MLDESAPEVAMAQEMAGRGFVAAIIETPDRVHMSCGSNARSIPSFATQVYGYRGPHDTRATALVRMCSRAAADCSAGIALHGLSIGGLITAYAPRVAVGVTAELRYSSGVVVPGSFSCCGIHSHNFSCCNPGGVVGGTQLSCIIDNATSNYLARSRRRLIMGGGDTECTRHAPLPVARSHIAVALPTCAHGQGTCAHGQGLPLTRMHVLAYGVRRRRLYLPQRQGYQVRYWLSPSLRLRV